MNSLSKFLLGTTAALVATSGINHRAFAQVTWYPNGASPPLSTGVNNYGDAIVNFNDITLKDYATIALTPGGGSSFSVTENSILEAKGFSNGGGDVTSPGLNTGVASGSNPYGYALYFDVTATATLTKSGSSYSGYFNSVSYTLYGVSECAGTPTISFGSSTAIPSISTPSGAPCTGGAGLPVKLATGNLDAPAAQGPGNSASINAINQPSADIEVSLNPVNPTQTGFYVAPGASVMLALNTDFTNNSSEISLNGLTYQIGNTTQISLKGGGNKVAGPGDGSVTITIPATVPEPASLTLLGSGLAGLSMLRRKRK